jgi:hypothetical protein
MKDDSSSADRPNSSVVQLVGALNDMRDTLVTLSLALHDYKFNLESTERQKLNQLSQELIEKAKRLGR